MLGPVGGPSSSFYDAWRKDPNLVSYALCSAFNKVRATDVVDLKRELAYLSKNKSSDQLVQQMIRQLVGRGFVAPEKDRPDLYRITERGLAVMDAAKARL